jgi:hypothetical protein
MRKFLSVVVLIVSMFIMVGFASAQTVVPYKTDKTEDLGIGFEAKHITHENETKAILVKFPEDYLQTDETFENGIKYSITKLFGEKDFCDTCKVKFVSTHNAIGMPLLFIESTNWTLLVKPIVNNFQELKIIGIEIVPKKLGVDL